MNWPNFINRIFRVYYYFKFYLFRSERLTRRAQGPERGFVGIQIDGLSAPHLQTALEKGYLPHIARHLSRGYQLREYQAGLPSTTPAAQAAIFYGQRESFPAFRWFEKASGQIISCNDPDHVQHVRQRLFAGRSGLLDGGSSYSNILDGGANRSVFTVSSPHPQTLFGRFGGWRLLLLLVLHPLRVCRMLGASLLELVTDHRERLHARRHRRWQVSPGLFPFIRIISNVLLRELQTFGVIADIYAGVPAIYTTYSGYDELAHHYGPGSRPAMKNLKYTDQRIGEIMRMLHYAPGARYELIILSDHGQTPGYPFHSRFGATLGDAVSAFLRQNQQAAVSSGPLEFTHVQLGYLDHELEAHPGGWRYRLYRAVKNVIQSRIRQLVPETIKVDLQGGIVITYSSCLAHLYLTGEKRRLSWQEVDALQQQLLPFLSRHKGVGLVLARDAEGRLCFFHAAGMFCLREEQPATAEELAFLRIFGDPEQLLPELQRFGMEEEVGDLIIFGAYDGERIACFDDQVGGHGSIGGEQLRPFLILPSGHPLLGRDHLSGHAFLYHEVFLPLRQPL
ncbi:MAG: alkaline phosphatase family protein [Trichloromonadaceae bacterium]